MTYRGKRQKSYIGPIQGLVKVLILIEMHTNRNSFCGSRTAGRRGVAGAELHHTRPLQGLTQ